MYQEVKLLHNLETKQKNGDSGGCEPRIEGIVQYKKTEAEGQGEGEGWCEQKLKVL